MDGWGVGRWWDGEGRNLAQPSHHGWQKSPKAIKGKPKWQGICRHTEEDKQSNHKKKIGIRKITSQLFALEDDIYYTKHMALLGAILLHQKRNKETWENVIKFLKKDL